MLNSELKTINIVTLNNISSSHFFQRCMHGKTMHSSLHDLLVTEPYLDLQGAHQSAMKAAYQLKEFVLDIRQEEEPIQIISSGNDVKRIIEKLNFELSLFKQFHFPSFLPTHVDDVLAAYQEFLREGNQETANGYLSNCSKFVQRFQLLEKELQRLIQFGDLMSHEHEAFISTLENKDKFRKIEFEFYSHPTIDSLAGKLNAITRIHEELLLLLKLNKLEHPLYLVNISTGCLTITISTTTIVSGIIVYLTKRFIDWLFQEFSSGNIASVNNMNVETLEKQYELAKKLEAEGFNIKDIQKNIHRCLIKSNKELVKFIGSEPRFLIDGQEFDIGLDEKDRFIEEVKILKIEENKKSEKKEAD